MLEISPKAVALKCAEICDGQELKEYRHYGQGSGEQQGAWRCAQAVRAYADTLANESAAQSNLDDRLVAQGESAGAETGTAAADHLP